MLMTPKYRSNQDYLRSQQYKDSSNLNARFQLHDRFSINKYGWHQWVFDHVDIPPHGHILELGCGAGYLWQKNLDRIPRTWEITLSDFSSGMLRDARNQLGNRGLRFRFQTIDAQSIPYTDETFDAVIANHMLYHVPDRNRAFSEISRILKVGGCLYATTNGLEHLRELGELVREFAPDYASERKPQSFNLENGREQLSKWFAEVKLWRYEDGLIVTDVEALTAWAGSWAGSVFGEARLSEFVKFLVEKFEERKEIRVTKDSGAFQARKSNRV